MGRSRPEPPLPSQVVAVSERCCELRPGCELANISRVFPLLSSHSSDAEIRSGLLRQAIKIPGWAKALPPEGSAVFPGGSIPAARGGGRRRRRGIRAAPALHGGVRDRPEPREDAPPRWQRRRNTVLPPQALRRRRRSGRAVPKPLWALRRYVRELCGASSRQPERGCCPRSPVGDSPFPARCSCLRRATRRPGESGARQGRAGLRPGLPSGCPVCCSMLGGAGRAGLKLRIPSGSCRTGSELRIPSGRCRVRAGGPGVPGGG